MSNKGSIRSADIKVLWGRSGNICAMCKITLAEDDTTSKPYLIGEMAHIEGENLNSARYNKDMTDPERNCYENLILLCPSCHTQIDKNPSNYSVAYLHNLKKDHETWVSKTLQSRMVQMNFSELDVICKYLINTPITDRETITVIPPREKIYKNNLSTEVSNLILSGMLQTKLVKDYLNRNIDIDFSERLRAGFVKKYQESVANGFKRDALFYELFDFAAHNSADFNTRAAGLAVLTYFFEICEVFEK